MIAWVVLVGAWGRFWRADQRLGDAPEPPKWPEVVAVIPARNEVATIARVVAAHAANGYPGRFRVIVVDDNSTDGTGDAARAAGADVVVAPPLPQGWSGKMAAVHAGLTHAEHAAPDATWVLLTDADILHAPGTLQRLVAAGISQDRALVSLMARLDTSGFWGRLLIPAFVFFFQKLYPFPWVNRPGHWCAAAAGGCVLVCRDALRSIGGVAAIRGALIDDVTLATRIKCAGHAIWLGLADQEVLSLRDNGGLQTVWSMVARTAFTQLRHSTVLLAGSVLGMVVLYGLPVILPILGMATGDIMLAVTGAIALALMLMAYAPTARLYGVSWTMVALLPLAGVLYTAMTLSSAWRHWRGRGGRWKGRTYP